MIKFLCIFVFVVLCFFVKANAQEAPLEHEAYEFPKENCQKCREKDKIIISLEKLVSQYNEKTVLLEKKVKILIDKIKELEKSKK